MKLEEFLLEKTRLYELCVVKKDNQIIDVVYIYDNKNVHHNIPEEYLNSEVKKDTYGKLRMIDRFDELYAIPCHYVEI